jgi:hypothetical protein
MVPWAHKIAMRSVLMAGATLLATLALAPTASAQIVISVNPPVCEYGYYDSQPYACAPMGLYGPAISSTVFSWAWARGVTGVTTTDGVVIASAVVAEDATAAGMNTAVGVAPQEYALAEAAVPTEVAHMPQQHAVVAPLMARQCAVVVALTAAVADRMVAVGRMAAASAPAGNC